MKVHSLVPLAVCAAAGCTSPSPPRAFSLPSDVELGAVDISIETDGPIAYRRNVYVDGAGRMSVVYVRETPDGSEVSIDRAEYKEFVEPVLDRIEETLPETCAAWIESCPRVRDEVARLVEGGATFRGGSRTGVVGPYFWCETQSVRRELKNAEQRDFIDPLDTLAVFLVAGYEALEGTQPGARTADRRAQLYAERVLRTVELFHDEADCLDLDMLANAYGQTFRRWEAMVDLSGGDAAQLAEMFLEQDELAAWD